MHLFGEMLSPPSSAAFCPTFLPLAATAPPVSGLWATRSAQPLAAWGVPAKAATVMARPRRAEAVLGMCIVPPSQFSTPDNPISNVGVDGGDVWSGQRLSPEQLERTVNEAISTVVGAPIIAQYYPGRSWLWSQWSSTVRH